MARHTIKAGTLTIADSGTNASSTISGRELEGADWCTIISPAHGVTVNPVVGADPDMTASACAVVVDQFGDDVALIASKATMFPCAGWRTISVRAGSTVTGAQVFTVLLSVEM